MWKIILFSLLSLALWQFLPSDCKILYHSDKIWVYEYKTRRCLSFSKPPSATNQSCIYLDYPQKLVFDYQKVIMAGLYLQPNPRNILIIGLGGGTVVRALQSILPLSAIDVVEINPSIVGVAKKYFAFQDNEHIRIFHQDGFDFVVTASNRNQKYDLIIVDAFDEEYVPQSMLSETFISALRHILAGDGLVVVNTFMKSAYNDLENELYYKYFGSFYDIHFTNRIIMAGKFSSASAREKIAEKFDASFQKLGIRKSLLLDKFERIYSR